MGEFHYRVTDDGMSGDRLCKGDFVVIQETQSVLSNDICAIASGLDVSQLVFRRIESNGSGYRLTPSNPEFVSDLRETILLVGKVIAIHINT